MGAVARAGLVLVQGTLGTAVAANSVRQSPARCGGIGLVHTDCTVGALAVGGAGAGLGPVLVAPTHSAVLVAGTVLAKVKSTGA